MHTKCFLKTILKKRTTNSLSFRVQARIVYPLAYPLNSTEKGMHGVVIEKTSADGRGRQPVYYYQGHGIKVE